MVGSTKATLFQIHVQSHPLDQGLAVWFFDCCLCNGSRPKAVVRLFAALCGSSRARDLRASVITMHFPITVQLSARSAIGSTCLPASNQIERTLVS